MLDVTSAADWERLLAEACVVVYKHSPICPLGGRALRQVRRFEELCPDVPVHQVDVVRQRPLANRIAEDLEVRHESPQVIVMTGGEPRWHASHSDVTTEGLLAAIPD